MDSVKNKNALDSFLLGKKFHVAIILLGVVFLSLNAFHSNVWFDESYSVAIANHDFGEIWYIGSGDVHPVLYYWCLHVLNLVFGQNLVVYRLFTLLGIVACAFLGYFCIRKDFGAKIGVLFTFFVLIMPYVTIMATEIRMYAWVFFTVFSCAIFAFRIAKGLSNKTAVPIRWWVFFFASSLASAYLHYFGVLAAFVIQLLLLIFFIKNAREQLKPFLIFLGQAVIQVVAYLPWLYELLNQVGVISESYWASITLETIFNMFTYLVATDNLCFSWWGEYGSLFQMLMIVFLCLFIVLFVLAFVALRRRKKRTHSSPSVSKNTLFKDKFGERSDVFAAWLAFGVYAGVIALALIVSVAMHSYILYYRYAFVSSSLLIFSIAVLITRLSLRRFTYALCTLSLAVSLANVVVLLEDNYSSQNDLPLDYFESIAKDIPVVSSDIGIEGVTSVTYPQVKQTYLDWQPGNWERSYLAYSPTLTSVYSWDQALGDYHGKFIVLGQSAHGEEPNDLKDLLNKDGISMVEFKEYYRPYERTYFTVALLEKA